MKLSCIYFILFYFLGRFIYDGCFVCARTFNTAVSEKNKTDAITVSDSSASQTDSGVHWDFSSRSSARRIQLASHLRRIKEEDGAQEVDTGFPSSDDAEESTITRYNATVAGLAHLCHCMNTPG